MFKSNYNIVKIRDYKNSNKISIITYEAMIANLVYI